MGTPASASSRRSSLTANGTFSPSHIALRFHVCISGFISLPSGALADAFAACLDDTVSVHTTSL